MKKYFCVISHTHWDREWYLPLEHFRLKLCDLFDHCLEIMDKYPEYIFHMDGQTVVLEDYLAIRPSKRGILQKYISEGRLVVGPWYLQNDFYLTSGESTIRNLIEGHKISAEYGACMKVGYAPDQFGNISQLPQILKDFGIDSFIFGRGLPPQKQDESRMPSEFIWQGADGTRALAIHMTYWYNNAQHISHDMQKAQNLINSQLQMFEGVAVTPYILMMNGVDHLEAQPDLPPVLDKLNDVLSDKHLIKQCNMADYVNNVKCYIKQNNIEPHIQKGELRYGPNGMILQGTLSSRSYLKAENVKAQTMLENKIEPVYAMLEIYGAKGAYSVDHMRYMWKELIKNHPHDSICGCSCDEVHNHMEDNYARLCSTSGEMLCRGMDIAAGHMDIDGFCDENYIITVANTTETVQNATVFVTVDIKQDENWAGIDIFDGAGNHADFIVTGKCAAVKDTFSPLNLPGKVDVDRYDVYLDVNNGINGLSFKGYTVRENRKANEIAPLIKDSRLKMENEHLAVEVTESGQVNITHKSTGKAYNNAIDIEDAADCGDSYTFWDSEDTSIFGSEFKADISVVLSNEYVKKIAITLNMVIPAEYDFDNKCRSEETVGCPVTLILTLSKYSHYLEIDYEIDNKAKDHRMRLVVNTGIAGDTSVADIPFDIISHDKNDLLSGKEHPNTSFALLQDNNGGIAALTEGQQEYEHVENSLRFTLLRATGVIFRDRGTMKNSSGPQWDCPGNQCIRKMTGRIAVLPFEKDYLQSGIPISAKFFKTGLLSYYNSCNHNKFMAGRFVVQECSFSDWYFLPDPYKNVKIPDNTPAITIMGESIQLSAFKLAERGDEIIVRCVNLSENGTVFNIKMPDMISKTTMSETERYIIAKGELSEKLRGKQIITLSGKY